MTIDDLAERLSLSRSTIYYWVKDLPIPAATENRSAAQRRGTLGMQRKHQSLREQAYAEGIETFSLLATDPLFRDFVCLYIAEGSKRSRNSVALCNSDPAVVKLANHWMSHFSRRPVRYCVQYHADQRLSELQAFWSIQVGVPPDAIKLQRKSNSNQLRKRTWRSKYGVLTVRTSDTLFRATLDAWMDLLRASWN